MRYSVKISQQVDKAGRSRTMIIERQNCSVVTAVTNQPSPRDIFYLRVYALKDIVAFVRDMYIG